MEEARAPGVEAVRGLTAAAARARLAIDGPNVLVPEGRSHRVKRLVGPLGDPMVVLLLVAAPTYLLVGETTDAVVALVALVPIVALGWLLEARAERTLEQLRRLTARTALVTRDGTEQAVPAEELVVGDVITVHEGDVVPADAVVLDLTQILVDESSLTGESLPVGKELDGDDDARLLAAGTTVLSGRARAEVVATGTDTRYGAIGRLVAETSAPPTPLQRSMARLVVALSVMAGIACITVVAVALLHGEGWGSAVIAGVSLAIAAIPEEFSVVYTLYLALGAWRLTQDRALVRRLPTVETLGSTTVICTDKTGTLTHGRLAIAALWTPGGGVHAAGEPLDASVTPLLRAAVLATEPEPFDPLDVAIVDVARAAGIDVDALHAATLVSDWPFDPVDKYLTHTWDDGTARTVASKGAIEGVLRHGTTSAEDVSSAFTANAHLSAQGMRVIAVAAGTAPVTSSGRADDEESLRLLGLVAFSDPVRDGVRDALDECRAAGIRVVMITGDHPATAHAVAEGLGLPHESGGVDVIATGDMVDDADDAALARLVTTANVFARTRPEHKHRLVGALRARGDVVAMTGDGINDAPALREADIGVAMGERGTAAAREAAALVLLDDNFTTIVRAVRDGRRIVDNLAHAFAYVVAFHPALLVGALVAPLLGEPLMLLPVHLVALELVLHPVISLVFQAEPAREDTMHRPPRAIGDAVRLRALAHPFAVGLVLAALIVVAYLAALRTMPDDAARAVAFASLLGAQPVLVIWSLRAHQPLRRRLLGWTGTLTVVVISLTVLTVAVVHVGPLTSLLHLEPFPSAWWLVVLGIALSTSVTWPVAERLTAPRRLPARSDVRR